MQNSAREKHSDILNTQSNANETHNNESLIERDKIENTPFYLIKENNQYFAVYGNYRITERFTTAEQVFEDIEKRMWEIITNICIITHELIAKNVTDYVEKQNNDKGPLFGNYKIDEKNSL